ncbi:hypothetical protein [Streptomyces sp. NPDC019890]|uniref:hypothetical protein n=1 Tax=Streptomyces sp. NPDC019890 TaxID=3365064 RepID=UPI00384FD9FD
MTLKFLGIIADTPTDESPTIWLHEETGDLLIQSNKATEEEVKGCQEMGSAPGLSTDVPDHETIIRLPAVMLQYIPRPDDDSEETDSGVEFMAGLASVARVGSIGRWRETSCHREDGLGDQWKVS